MVENHLVKMLVGEPYEFANLRGSDDLLGKIACLSIRGGRETLLVVCEEFVAIGKRYNHLLGTKRYLDPKTISEDIEAGWAVTISFTSFFSLKPIHDIDEARRAIEGLETGGIIASIEEIDGRVLRHHSYVPRI